MGIKLLIVLSVLVLTGEAYADINSVTSAPSTKTVTVNGPTTIDLTWRINRTETVGGPTTGGDPILDPATGLQIGVTPIIQQPISRLVSSSNALLQIGGSTVATLAGTVNKTSTLSLSQSVTVMINESFTISAALARKIAMSPAGSVKIVRSFTDSQTTGSGSLNIVSRSESQGPLAIKRIDLAFENRARTNVIYNGDSVHAIADIIFNSSGILKGEWRIVDPSASLGSGGGRVLKVIRQNLVSSGQGRTQIVSPALPTTSNGLYLVAFVVDDDNLGFETPVLRYFVLDDEAASLSSKPSLITVLSPKTGAALNKGTVFKWNSVAGANAYQVELFNKGDEFPLTGKLVPATDLKLSLTALSFEKLEPGTEYTWRVRAFGEKGKLLGQSSFQTLYTP